MVIDRLQLYIFLAVTIGGTVGILINAPHIFEYVNQNQIKKEIMGETWLQWTSQVTYHIVVSLINHCPKSPWCAWAGGCILVNNWLRFTRCICKLLNHWRSLKWSRANSWLAVARLTPLKKKVYLQQQFPTSTRHWPIIGIKLGQRLRRWPNVITTIILCLVFVVKTVDPAPQQCLRCLPRVQTRTTQWLVLQF